MKLDRRFFYSRYFITGAIAIAVLGIAAAYRVANGAARPDIIGTPGVSAPSAHTGAKVAPGRPVVHSSVRTAPRHTDSPSATAGEEDGVASVPQASAAPSVSGGAADLSGATAKASQFAHAWLARAGLTDDAWRGNLAPLAATDFRTNTLPTMTPSGITATTITGDIGTHAKADAFVESDVPMDGGTLVLTLLADSGQWFVSGVDWTPAS